VEAAAVIFANTRMLWMSAALLPLSIWFLWWSWRRKQQLMRLFVSDRLRAGLLDAFSPERQRTKAILWVMGILFLLLSLARPQWGFIWEEATQKGRDIVVAIDTSRSMLAQDMAPDRLTRAKLAALDLLRLAKSDRLGLVAFAGTAFLQCPLTMDDEVFRQNVSALNIGIIPQGGTAIGEAIDVALDAFASEEGENHRVLVIFTDGEDHETDAVKVVEKARERNVKIFTVGVGTPAGQILKVTDEQGRESFIKDQAGNVVQSKLNEDLLRQIATEGSGFYLPLRDANAMQVLFTRGIEPLAAGDISSKLMRRRSERFYWPLGLAVLLLLIEAMLPSAPRRLAKAVVAAMLMIMLAGSAEASPASAYKRFKEGRFKDARNEYERLLEKAPNDPRLQYNAGAAAFQAGEYDTAAKGFGAGVTAPDLELQESAYYNLGNANYRLGEQSEDAKVKEGLWQQAVKNYESALKLNPTDQDARFNQQVVQTRLEELQKQQQQQQKKKGDNQDNKNKDDQEQQQGKDDQKKDNEEQNQNQQGKQDQKDNEEKKDQQKQEQNQQQGDKQEKQDQQGQDKKESQNEGSDSKSEQNEGADKERAEKEARAMQLGQMTERQAERMLDAQRGNEKAMIFQQSNQKSKNMGRAIKDW
jgi:Ca-activated chloride channel homolog